MRGKGIYRQKNTAWPLKSILLQTHKHQKETTHGKNKYMRLKLAWQISSQDRNNLRDKGFFAMQSTVNSDLFVHCRQVRNKIAVQYRELLFPLWNITHRHESTCTYAIKKYIECWWGAQWSFLWILISLVSTISIGQPLYHSCDSMWSPSSALALRCRCFRDGVTNYFMGGLLQFNWFFWVQ